jgi:protein-arginine kinase activator protein McsA
MLCEKCQKREATCHVMTEVEGGSTTSDLCNECFEATPSKARDLAAEMEAARCQYCGDKVFTAASESFMWTPGVEQTKYMCRPCTLEHQQFTQQELQKMSPGGSQQEQLAAIRALNEKTDQHMREWVAKKQA